MADSPLERRATLRLLAYWEKLRGGRLMPSERDIKADDIADLWPSCFLVHGAGKAPAEYRYSYMGEAVAEICRFGCEHDSVALHPQDELQGFAQVFATGKPLIDEGEFLNAAQEIVRFRRCLLPLGEDGAVQAIFGVARFRLFAQVPLVQLPVAIPLFMPNING